MVLNVGKMASWLSDFRQLEGRGLWKKKKKEEKKATTPVWYVNGEEMDNNLFYVTRHNLFCKSHEFMFKKKKEDLYTTRYD